MAEPAPSTLPHEAGSPFDAPDADIILRSVDGVDFRTYKSYLTRALHGFDDMLHAGHLNGIGGVEALQNGVLVIPLPESSAVLNLFLRTIYPVEFGCPALSDHLGVTLGVCKALSKYCVKNFPLSVKNALLLAADKEPEIVYAITCRYDTLTDIAKIAAKNTLRKMQRLDNLPDDVVAEISAPQYHALAKYQVACRVEAVEACRVEPLQSRFSDTPGAVDIHGSDSGGCICTQHHEIVNLDELSGSPEWPDVDNFECVVPEWLTQYLGDVRNELIKGDKICGSVALDARYMAKAIEAGRGCPVCGKGVLKFIRFAEFMKWAIDNAVSRVAFQSSAVAA